MTDQNQNQNQSNSLATENTPPGVFSPMPLKSSLDLKPSQPAIVAEKNEVTITPPGIKTEETVVKTIDKPEEKPVTISASGLIDIPVVAVKSVEPVLTADNQTITNLSPLHKGDVFQPNITTLTPEPDHNKSAETENSAVIPEAVLPLPGKQTDRHPVLQYFTQPRSLALKSVLSLVIIGTLSTGGYFGYQNWFVMETTEKPAADSVNSVEKNSNTTKNSNIKFGVLSAEEVSDESKNTNPADENSADQKRQKDLEEVRQALQSYYNEMGSYPAADNLIQTLKDKKLLETIPVDPKQGSKTTDGKDQYAYMYAVYDTATGPKTAFILSSRLEFAPADKSVFIINSGQAAANDFRDLSKAYVTILSENKNTDSPKPKPKIKRK